MMSWKHLIDSFAEPCQCGKFNINLQPTTNLSSSRIIGGFEVQPHYIPYQVRFNFGLLQSWSVSSTYILLECLFKKNYHYGLDRVGMEAMKN